ncbi:N-acetyltransferase [Ensifer sp. MPMI2T]|nr:N-acetyltransferase [Ensifer sp. MPMI2T]
MTSAARATNASASPLPKPRLPPTTTIRFPSRSISQSSFGSVSTARRRSQQRRFKEVKRVIAICDLWKPASKKSDSTECRDCGRPLRSSASCDKLRQRRFLATWQLSVLGRLVSPDFLASLPAEHQASRHSRIFSKPGVVYRVATIEGPGIVGFASGGPGRQTEFFEGAELYAIYLRPEFERQGIGRALFRAVATELIETSPEGFYLTALSAKPNRRFYRSMGGREVNAPDNNSVSSLTLRSASFGTIPSVTLREVDDRKWRNVLVPADEPNGNFEPYAVLPGVELSGTDADIADIREPNCLALRRPPALALRPGGVGHDVVDGERGTFGPSGGERVLAEGFPCIGHVAVVTVRLDRPASQAHLGPQCRGGAEEAGRFRTTVVLHCQTGQRLE